MKRFYRPDEVADILGVSTKTVYRLIKEDRLKAVKIRSILRIPERELDKLTRLKKSTIYKK
ncbi:helix-turn-helix domain-containing protein [Desulfoferrobacter suflitae]|uniref:helix-turn-helix domain-containing protein n=1 Tax=Desulfoferrobacter suflitae TaxID=2865782 RepID=UPI002164BBD0|nr:helix-turn-helix domain-containing protein [Desulfoferrobacter suflitae]MCK8604405.1 helix-turn-helix domain-containing protein [Desulfoferrobacter suflitae]